MTEAIDELSVFEGVRPEGDLALESQGMAPIPEDARYGGTWRMFTVWFTPNMELSGVFAGTLAVTVGLGFGLGLVAIIVGTVIGSVPVAILCTWGPRTGAGQVPLARLPFGKAIILPGTVQWLSSVAWDALFGGEAAQLLLGIPFWAGAAIVLAVEGVVSIYGYEFVHRLQSWGSAAPAKDAPRNPAVPMRITPAGSRSASSRRLTSPAINRTPRASTSAPGSMPLSTCARLGSSRCAIHRACGLARTPPQPLAWQPSRPDPKGSSPSAMAIFCRALPRIAPFSYSLRSRGCSSALRNRQPIPTGDSS